MSEQKLISQLKEGSEPVFRQLVAQYQDMVFNTAIGLLQQQNDAEDVTQEVFMQVHRSIQQFKEEAALSTWLYRITITKSLDFLRAKKRKKRFGFISSLFANSNQPLYEPIDFYHPGVALDKKEDAAILFKAIRLLPENQQTAFVLNKLEGLNYTEIGVILSVSESAVDSLLQRAKQNLRKQLGKFPT